jgi:hypothetical protein
MYTGLRIAAADLRLSGKRVAAIFDGASNFGHAIGARRNGVFKLDRRLDVPLVVAELAQDFCDRSIALAERRVGPVMQLPIFQMHVRNAAVMLLDERDRRNIVAGDEMP